MLGIPATNPNQVEKAAAKVKAGRPLYFKSLSRAQQDEFNMKRGGCLSQKVSDLSPRARRILCSESM